MARSGYLALVSLLLLIPSLFFVSPATATADGLAFGGRRSLLQSPSPAPTPDSGATPTTPAGPTPQTSTPVTPGPSPVPIVAPTPVPISAPVPAPMTPGPSPVPIVAPTPVPISAPVPDPTGVTNSQRRNAIIAASVVGSVLLVALVLIFCRCQCLRRTKRLPFQRLQMT